MRPIKQRDSFGCGPVSIYNALALLGIKSDLKDLYAQCNTKKVVGTYPKPWLKTMKAAGFSVTKMRDPYKMTDKGSYFVFMTKDDFGKRYGHFVFVKDGWCYNLGKKFRLRVSIKNYEIRSTIMYSPPKAKVEIWEVTGFRKVGK